MLSMFQSESLFGERRVLKFLKIGGRHGIKMKFKFLEKKQNES